MQAAPALTATQTATIRPRTARLRAPTRPVFAARKHKPRQPVYGDVTALRDDDDRGREVRFGLLNGLRGSAAGEPPSVARVAAPHVQARLRSRCCVLLHRRDRVGLRGLSLSSTASRRTSDRIGGSWSAFPCLFTASARGASNERIFSLPGIHGGVRVGRLFEVFESNRSCELNRAILRPLTPHEGSSGVHRAARPPRRRLGAGP